MMPAFAIAAPTGRVQLTNGSICFLCSGSSVELMPQPRFIAASTARRTRAVTANVRHSRLERIRGPVAATCGCPAVSCCGLRCRSRPVRLPVAPSRVQALHLVWSHCGAGVGLVSNRQRYDRGGDARAATRVQVSAALLSAAYMSLFGRNAAHAIRFASRCRGATIQ